MKNVFKRLTTGFMCSVMTLSFILMPIPKVSISYAADTPSEEESTASNVYQPGEELTKAQQTASFESSARYKDGKKVLFLGEGMIEQYIVALTGVVLINALNWKHLHKYNPVAYGNDCPTNFGAKIGIPVAGVSGLANVIGDLSANIKFRKLAKGAADASFAPEPGATGNDFYKNLKTANKQIEAFDKLIEILKGQKKAVRLKKGFALAATIGFGVSAGVEAANMIHMASICSGEKTATVAQTTVQTTELTAGTTAITTTAATPPYAFATPCANAEGQLIALEGKDKVQTGLNLAMGGKKTLQTLKVAKKTKDGLTFIQKLLKLTGKKVMSTGFEVGVELGSKALDIAAENADDLLATAEAGAVVSQLIAHKSQCLTTDTAVMTCAPAAGVALNYTASSCTNPKDGKLCCGGPGINLQLETYLTTGGLVSANVFAPVKQKLIETTKMTLVKKIVKQIITELIGVPRFLIPKDKITLGSSGTLKVQGVPTPPGVAYAKKDVKVMNLFGNVTASNYSPTLSPQKVKQIEDLKFFINNTFEYNIRKLALEKFSVEKDKSARYNLAKLREQNRKVDNVLHAYSSLLDKQFYNLYNYGEFDSSSSAFQNLISSLSNLLIPRAEAGFGGILVGAGMDMLGKSVDGPWSEVLSLGGRIIQLQGMIGKFMKRTALTSPLGRSLTWVAMSALSKVSHGMAKKTEKDIDKNLKIVEEEKKKYKFSAKNTGVVDGGEILDLEAYVPPDLQNHNPVLSEKNCVKKATHGFAPTTCDKKQPEKDFKVAGLQVSGASGAYVNGANMLSGLTTLGANNSISADTFSDSKMAKMESAYNAIRAKNDKFRKRFDDMYKSAAKKDRSVKLPGIQSAVAKLRKDILKGSASQNGLSNFGSNPVANSAPTEKSSESKNSEKVASINIPKPTTPKAGGSIDLGFDSDDSLVDDALADDGKKDTISIDEYIVKQDTISKKKDVSIFKILSKRYLISYPKVLEEKK